MKTYVIGDAHGGYRALIQCLERSKFDKENDRLIVLGDVCDGWPETPEVIEELLTIKNLILIKGNHDHWASDWMEYGRVPEVWTMQGGQATLDAYMRRPELIGKHRDVLMRAPVYYIDEENRIYCHGGFLRGVDVKSQLPSMFMWDRTLAEKAVSGRTNPHFAVHEYKEVYLGHTTVNSFKGVDKDQPIIAGNVILLDTGGGMEGVVTIMDVDSKEFWQSDVVASLYPEHTGRSGKKYNS